MQQEFIERINQAQLGANELIKQYWQQYSNMGTWQFWVNATLLILPLIFLYFYIDKENMWRILFFGLITHGIFTYIDSYAVRYAYWRHTYMVFPQFPFSVPIDVSLLPVTFMFVYQLYIKYGINFYLWSAMNAALFGVIVTSLFLRLNLFQLYRGLSVIHIFLVLYFTAIISYWFNSWFSNFQKKSKNKNKYWG